MNSYYCIVNMPSVPAREIQVLDARSDAGAIAALDRVAEDWTGFETICLYQGERLVKVLGEPSSGSAQSEPSIETPRRFWAAAA